MKCRNTGIISNELEIIRGAKCIRLVALHINHDPAKTINNPVTNDCKK
jgi:hypothetical protein